MPRYETEPVEFRLYLCQRVLLMSRGSGGTRWIREASQRVHSPQCFDLLMLVSLSPDVNLTRVSREDAVFSKSSVLSQLATDGRVTMSDVRLDSSCPWFGLTDCTTPSHDWKDDEEVELVVTYPWSPVAWPQC